MTPDLEVKVSSKLRDQYRNGRTYYPLEGRVLRTPAVARDRPDPTLLEWHSSEVFLQ